MNDIKKEEMICGFTLVPEIYCDYIDTPLTKIEKRKIFIYKVKEIIIEALWHIFLFIGIALLVSGYGYLIGIFFKMGAS